MQHVTVYKGRTTLLRVSLGYDVSNDTITSEIRVDPNRESELIASWNVSFETDGADGELILTIDDSVSDLIDRNDGYMDLKRVTGGQPVPVFDIPLQVLFKDTVTV